MPKAARVPAPGRDRRRGQTHDPREQRPQKSAAACPAIPRTPRAATSKPKVGDLTIACLYLPNGNPAPGPKFDYKLMWFARLITHPMQPLAEERQSQ